MWNCTSGARGRRACAGSRRTRRRWTTAGRAPSVAHSARFSSVSASLRLTGSSNIHVDAGGRVVLEAEPDAGRPRRRSAPAAARARRGARCPTATGSAATGRRPPETMTSRSARNSSSSLSREPATPTARVPSKSTRWTCTWVSTVRFGRSIDRVQVGDRRARRACRRAWSAGTSRCRPGAAPLKSSLAGRPRAAAASRKACDRPVRASESDTRSGPPAPWCSEAPRLLSSARRK